MMFLSCVGRMLLTSKRHWKSLFTLFVSSLSVFSFFHGTPFIFDNMAFSGAGKPLFFYVCMFVQISAVITQTHNCVAQVC